MASFDCSRPVSEDHRYKDAMSVQKWDRASEIANAHHDACSGKSDVPAIVRVPYLEARLPPTSQAYDRIEAAITRSYKPGRHEGPEDTIQAKTAALEVIQSPRTKELGAISNKIGRPVTPQDLALRRIHVDLDVENAQRGTMGVYEIRIYGDETIFRCNSGNRCPNEYRKPLVGRFLVPNYSVSQSNEVIAVPVSNPWEGYDQY